MKIIRGAKHLVKSVLDNGQPEANKNKRIQQYISGGRIPWSDGYTEYKWDFIDQSIRDENVLTIFANRKPLPAGHGLKLDDRSVEYPWIFSKLRKGASRLLDAGSTFNFRSIVDHPAIEAKEATILTFFPEPDNFNNKRISYVYADLREMPLRDNWFDEVICQSTLEHIGMDNSIYGYQNASQDLGRQKDYSYRDAIHELIRVLKPGGQLLLTFPYGKYEFHGFFQQFDKEMVEDMLAIFEKEGRPENDFFLYHADGWHWSDIVEAAHSESFNPHTGVGKGTDGAAHSRAICCIKFIKGR